MNFRLPNFKHLRNQWSLLYDSYLKGNITAKYWSNPIKRVPSIDAFDTHEDTSSLIKHRMGWLRISERFHHFEGEMSKQMRGMSIKVEKRFTPKRLPTNLKREIVNGLQTKNASFKEQTLNRGKIIFYLYNQFQLFRKQDYKLQSTK